jgi:hypothetical protein
MRFARIFFGSDNLHAKTLKENLDADANGCSLGLRFPFSDERFYLWRQHWHDKAAKSSACFAPPRRDS